MPRAAACAVVLALLAVGCSKTDTKDTGPAPPGQDAPAPTPEKPKPGEKPKMI